ncbi:MAG: hypothetical protein HY860_04340 [Chlamydiales bacterium]|nr:hypothetical protein [Chlamydiales bacterium]
MSITRDPDFHVHPGRESAGLAMLQDQFFLQKTEKATSSIDDISCDLYIILNVLSEIRKAKEEQDGDHVDLRHLESDIAEFREVWNKCAYLYPGLIKEEENPFPASNDLSHVSKKELEWTETKLRNLETKRQGSIQTSMGEFETMTMAQKQIVEILVQIGKSIRESTGYWIKKTDSK